MSKTKLSLAVQWTLDTILEHGNLSRFVNRRTTVIVIAWVFTTLLIRNLFSGRMFSKLTSEQKPRSLPESSYKLFGNHKLVIVGDKEVLEQLVIESVIRPLSEFINLRQSLLSRMVLFYYNVFDANYVGLSRDGHRNISTLNTTECVQYNPWDIL